MDSPSSGNPASGGATGDLWKKVLEEVQSEAAARRSKVGARSASAPKTSNIETDLLKRILVAIESKPAGAAPVDHSELLHQILDAIKHPPQLDPSQITSPLLAAIEKADHDKRFKELEASFTAQFKAMMQAQQPMDVEAIAARLREAIAAEKPVDLSPQLAEIRQSIEALPKAERVDVDGLVARVRETIVANKATDVSLQLAEIRQSIDALPKTLPKAEPVDVDELVAKINETIAANKATDVSPLLMELKQTIEAMPKAEAVDVESVVSRISEAIAAAKPADNGPQLEALQKAIRDLPVPVDSTAKFEVILAAAKERPDDGRDEILLQILEGVQKQSSLVPPQTSDVTAQLPMLLDQLENKLAGRIEAKIGEAAQAIRESKSDGAVNPAAIEQRIETLRGEIKAELDSHFAALPRPVDQTEKLQAIVDAIAAKQVVDADSLVQRVGDTVKSHLPLPAVPVQDPGPALESLTAKVSEIRETQQQFRDSVQQEIFKQNAAVREDLLAQSIEVIDQVKAVAVAVAQANQPIDVDALIARLTEEWRAQTPAPLDAAALVEQIRAVVPAQVPLDTDALVEKLRGAIPAPASFDTASLIEQIRSAIPKPAPVELPEIPSHAHDFAKQQAMLSELMQLVKSQAASSSSELEESATDAIRLEVQTLIKQHKQTQQQMDRTISSFSSLSEDLGSAIESKLNSGLAKLELALATSDTGRPSSLTADGVNESRPPVSNYRYSWMNQPASRNRTPTIALTVTAIAAVGMFLVLLINALTGNNNNNTQPTPNNNNIASNNNPSNTPPVVTPANNNTKATTPTPPVSTDKTKDDPAPLLTGPLFPKATGTGEPSRIADPLVNELKNLTNPGGEQTRAVYDIEKARKVVFLVHISGKSPTAMTTIISQLKKSIARLGPTQKFTIVFSEGNRFIEAPPAGLRDGSDGERSRVESWMDLNIRATSHRPASSPLVAIDVAMSYEPDLLWMISDAIVADEPGRVSSKEIVDRIAALNPQGLIRIAATQIGSPDNGSTLRTLAEKYGGAYIALGEGTSASIGP